MELLTDLWATTPPLLKAVGALAIPVLTFLAGRKLNRATITEKNANAADILQGLCDKLAGQLAKYVEAGETWKAQVAYLSADSQQCRATSRAIKDAAEILVTNIDAMSFAKAADEPVGPTERRFLAMKAAGAEIKALLKADSTPKDTPTVV